MILFQIPIITQIETVLEQTFGSLWLVGLAIIAFFAIVLLITGVDFRFSLMLILPLLLVFSNVGWFPTWVSGLIWIVVVGFGLYVMLNWLRDR